jgi:hypothetical protein
LVCAGTDGYIYDFEIYSGQENKYRLPDENNLGAAANVVMRLIRSVPRHMNYQKFFDNYYTTIPLLVELKKLGMKAIGTIRQNRIMNNKLSHGIEKKDRGYCEEWMSTVDGKNLLSK